MHKINSNHWAAYLAASEQATAKRRRPYETKDTTGICLVAFWIFAGGAAAVIGWLLLLGWR
jgi:hypothetical protein